LLTASAVPLVFRPMGPLPGGPGVGGALSAVWTDESVWIRLALADSTEDDGDRIALALSSGGVRVAEAEWVRTTGAASANDGDLEVEMSESGFADGTLAVTWRVTSDVAG